MTYGKPVSWRNFPNTPGKRILEEILSTPRPDFTQLNKDVAATKRSVHMNEKQRRKNNLFPHKTKI
ncbi:hypothetical protein [uncultured Treponema sp.]|uniref:hypothetical protein n=1 Tax=uncultured Treponema sp. TaxID=162155 RepID=UPI00260BEE54|nr:hypothetical protein [uncultured Treponema sp.]